MVLVFANSKLFFMIRFVKIQLLCAYFWLNSVFYGSVASRAASAVIRREKRVCEDGTFLFSVTERGREDDFIDDLHINLCL